MPVPKKLTATAELSRLTHCTVLCVLCTVKCREEGSVGNCLFAIVIYSFCLICRETQGFHCFTTAPHGKQNNNFLIFLLFFFLFVCRISSICTPIFLGVTGCLSIANGLTNDSVARSWIEQYPLLSISIRSCA